MPAPALMVKDLTVTSGNRTLVHHAGFSVEAGERVALLGASGSGKSLTAGALAGELPAGFCLTGRVSYSGVEAARHGRPAGNTVAMIQQDPSTALNPLVPVGQQLVIPLRRAGRPRPEAQAEAARLLARVGMREPGQILKRYTGELSGGQIQRVCIAMALACRSPFLIADEPTTALDPVNQHRVLEALRSWGSEGRGLLFITHDLTAAATLCSRALVMESGRVVEEAPMTDLLRRPQHPYSQRLVEVAAGPFVRNLEAAA